MMLVTATSCSKVTQTLPATIKQSPSSLPNLPDDVWGLILKILPHQDLSNASLVSKRWRRLTNDPHVSPQKAAKLRIFHNIIKKVYVVRAPTADEALRCQKIRKMYNDAYMAAYMAATRDTRCYNRDFGMRLMTLNAVFNASMQICRIRQIEFYVSSTLFTFFRPRSIQLIYQGSNFQTDLYNISLPSAGSIVHVKQLDSTKIYVRDSTSKEFIIDFSIVPVKGKL